MTDRLSDLPALAADFVNSTHRHIFLTGKAGTGKTTFLRGLAQHTHKRMVVVAPTGIAALNAGGATIHSLFMLPPATFVPNPTRKLTEEDHGLFNLSHLRRNSLSSQKKQVLRSMDLLVIDEVSMLRADLLDAIDARLRLTRGQHHLPFGGVQVLFIGDLLQLPPVVNRHADELRQYYPTPHFFQAHALRQDGVVYIELNKVFRQTDSTFVNVLNHLRENQLTEIDLQLLNSHVRPGPEGIITLTTHNRQADEINQQHLKKLPEKTFTYSAIITGDFPENLYPLEETITLKVGARVMFIRNDSSMEKSYFNGKLATVSSLEEDAIAVIMDGETTPFTLHMEEWDNKRYVVGKDSKELEEEVIGTFRHYPLRLAWAVTVHKSQGLTFDAAILDLGRSFSPGQVYVALSRLRSLDGLYLTSPLAHHLVAADGMALNYARQQPAPEYLPTMLEDGQRRFLHLLLDRAFTLDQVVEALQEFAREHSGTTFKEEALNRCIRGMEDRIKAEIPHSQTFRKQLAGLQEGGHMNQLAERLDKAQAYFLPRIEGELVTLLDHKAQVSRFSKIKAYMEGLDELDQIIYQWIQALERGVDLGKRLALRQKAVPNPDLEERRHAWRSTLLETLRARVADLPEEKPTTGRTRKKKGIKAPKAPKENTYDKTLAMLDAGKSLEEVAADRMLAPSTIEGHVARLISSGKTNIKNYLKEKDIERMAAVLSESESLTAAYQTLAESYSYNQLRMVQAWIEAQEKPVS